MHKFLTLDSISQSCYEVIENFKKLEFKCKTYENFKRKIIMLNIEKKFKATEVNTNDALEIVNSNTELCTIFNNNIKLKALLEFNICLVYKNIKVIIKNLKY